MRQWQVRRALQPHPDGQRRWDKTSYEGPDVKPVLFSAGRRRSFPCVLASVGAEVELRAARVALANLVSGGTASPPRSPVRVGGAPRRAAPLYISGAAASPRLVTAAAPSAPPGQFRPAGLARSV